MRPFAALAILAAIGLAACSRFDAPHAVASSAPPAARPDLQSTRDYSANASPISVANAALLGAGQGDGTPILLNRVPDLHRAPRMLPGLDGNAQGLNRAGPRPAESSFARGLLAFHNSVRAAVGEEPLVWSSGLADVAQGWADHLLATGAFAHHVGGPYGENLYDITGGTATPRHVVSKWADEVRDYDIQANACSGNTDCGHYTQIVWSTTRAVGCALAAASNRQVWVCEYYPAGNVIGYRPY
ncbi:MAG: hypothetical protein KGL55_01425 [Rhodospirillales bacterium]|nr:hypothetical protein [Rhodospirillales bacterium]